MTAPALLIGQDLTKTFPIEAGPFRRQVGVVRALDRVSFSVAPGEIVALVGGSGCGKTTLAKCVAGLLTPDSGQLRWDGQPLDGMRREGRARLIQMVFQDPYASLNPKLSIGTQLREALRLRGDGRPGPLLESVGLSADALGHYPFQFSGGQRQRIAIARALATQPQLLIADEPLSALDVTTQAQILSLFRQLQKNRGLAILLITHDLAVADALADRIVVLQEGRVVEEGPAQTVLSAPTQSYTRALVDAVPRLSW